MTLKYLITGATGGIGGGVLSYFLEHLQKSDFAVASSRNSSKEQFEKQGIAFRFADYGDLKSLEEAFTGVENLLFVSSNTFDNDLHGRQHKNVIDAAKKAGVGHVWYTSLAFGGHRSDSKVDVQQAHLVTEALLKESDIAYTSIREGIYAEAFPLFLNWYPDTKAICLPSDGKIAFTSRTELAEATARLMLKGGREKEIVLLTATKAYTFADLVNIINSATDRKVEIQKVTPEEYVKLSVQHDEGGKTEWVYKKRLSWFEGVLQGDGGAWIH